MRDQAIDLACPTELESTVGIPSGVIILSGMVLERSNCELQAELHHASASWHRRGEVFL